MEKITNSNANPTFGKNIGKDFTSVPAWLWNNAVDYVKAFLPSAGAITGNLTGNVTGNVTGGVVVANEATDTTCFPTFVTAATGALAPKSNANLTFNSNTATLACTNFTGALTGNASTATTATTALAANTIPNVSGDIGGVAPTNAQMVTAFGIAAVGKVGIYHDTNGGGKAYMCISTAAGWWQVAVTAGV